VVTEFLTDGVMVSSFCCFVQVASWGAYLLSRNILAMSFAPRDSHEAQVQFALERGVPAMIGVLASNRLTYPARSFDMAHCSRCLIPWQLYGMLNYYHPQYYKFSVSSADYSSLHAPMYVKMGCT
jgi:hypothetical protein